MIDVEPESNYVSIHIHGDPAPCVKRDTLQALASVLDARSFLRIRRNCIVNLKHVESIERIRDDYVVIFKVGRRIGVGRSYRAAVSHFLRCGTALIPNTPAPYPTK